MTLLGDRLSFIESGGVVTKTQCRQFSARLMMYCVSVSCLRHSTC